LKVYGSGAVIIDAAHGAQRDIDGSESFTGLDFNVTETQSTQ
jgi:hypothetical protein